MMQSEGAAASSQCWRSPLPFAPVASQTESVIAPIQAAECASTSTSVVACLPRTLRNARIAAAEGGYMNGNSRPVEGSG